MTRTTHRSAPTIALADHLGPASPVSGRTCVLAGVFPAPGLCFIRHVETVETYANSPIIVTPTTRDAIAKTQFIVVSVGDYERCEEEPGDCLRHHDKRGRHPHRLVEGDWVLVKNRTWGNTPDPDVYVVKQVDVLGKFVER